MFKRNNLVFNVLRIVAWIIFLGLCIDAGGLIVNFIFSLYQPDLVANLYQKLDLSAMYQESRVAFFGMYSFILTISIFKACLFYMLVKLVRHLDLLKPFSRYAADQIFTISFFTLCIGLVSYIAQKTADALSDRGFDVNMLNQFWSDSQAFILMSAVVYVIAHIFSRGVEIQRENDLTV